MFREGLRPPNPFRESDPRDALLTQDGMSLNTLASYGPVVVFCLLELKRADGMLRDIAARRGELEAAGKRVCLVHMGTDDEARAALEPHDLHYVARIADPERALYRAFGLGEEQPGLLGRALGAGPRQQAGQFELPKATR
jgi:hypothetical protein